MLYKRQLTTYKPIQIMPWLDGVTLVHKDGWSIPVVALAIFEQTTQYLEGDSSGTARERKYRDDIVDVFIDAVVLDGDGGMNPASDTGGVWQFQRNGVPMVLPSDGTYVETEKE